MLTQALNTQALMSSTVHQHLAEAPHYSKWLGESNTRVVAQLWNTWWCALVSPALVPARALGGSIGPALSEVSMFLCVRFCNHAYTNTFIHQIVICCYLWTRPQTATSDLGPSQRRQSHSYQQSDTYHASPNP